MSTSKLNFSFKERAREREKEKTFLQEQEQRIACNIVNQMNRISLQQAEEKATKKNIHQITRTYRMLYLKKFLSRKIYIISKTKDGKTKRV